MAKVKSMVRLPVPAERYLKSRGIEHRAFLLPQKFVELLAMSAERLWIIEKTTSKDVEFSPAINALRLSLFTAICEKWESGDSIENKIIHFFEHVDQAIVAELNTFFTIVDKNKPAPRETPATFTWILNHSRHNFIHLDGHVIMPSSVNSGGRASIGAMYGIKTREGGDFLVICDVGEKSFERIIELTFMAFTSYLYNKHLRI